MAQSLEKLWEPEKGAYETMACPNCKFVDCPGCEDLVFIPVCLRCGHSACLGCGLYWCDHSSCFDGECFHGCEYSIMDQCKMELQIVDVPRVGTYARAFYFDVGGES